MSEYKIAVIGLWHLGEIYSAGLAELGHKVVGISKDKKVIEDFSKNLPPLAEPQLEDLLKSNRAAGRLSYTTDFGEIKNCNVVWFTFDTPVDDNDEVDLGIVYDALEEALPRLQDGVLLIMTSQLPVGTSRKIKELVAKKRPGLKFDYVYTPENLRLGEAVKCFLEPGRIVVGADSLAAFQKIEEFFSPIKAEIVKMSVSSAEMAKHALNAFLATNLSFINDIADVCEKTGADILDVVKALRSDPRVGPKAYLDAGLGFSGGTLGRDLIALTDAGKEGGYSLPVIEAVYLKNKNRKTLVIKNLKKLLGDLKNKTIAILGVTYKAGTSTLRRSQALEVASDLRNEGATLRLHDPQAKREDISADPYEAAAGADAAVLMTPWPDFKNLDFVKLGKIMRSPAVFLDTRNFFAGRESEIRSAGLKYLGIGRNV